MVLARPRLDKARGLGRDTDPHGKGKAGSQRGNPASEMSQQPPKLDLHGRLKKHAFEHALITTYNFGSRFFERLRVGEFQKPPRQRQCQRPVG